MFVYDLIRITLILTALAIGVYNINTLAGKEIVAGEIANAIPFIANGFKMPAAYSGTLGSSMYIQMTSNTKFNFLGDFIVVINPFMTGNNIVVSPGDIAIGVGVCEILWNSSINSSATCTQYECQPNITKTKEISKLNSTGVHEISQMEVNK